MHWTKLTVFEGCEGVCALDTCGGVGCLTGDCGYGVDGGDGDDDPDEDCDDPVTAAACTMFISSWSTSDMTEYSTTTKVWGVFHFNIPKTDLSI